MENPQHNVGLCFNSALAKSIEENRHIPSVFYFVDGNAWHLREMVHLDIMVTKRFLSINEGIQLAKHNSIINAHLERPKLKNTMYASPNV